MNKEVIYIEPEDDITDIISKIEKSKEKIIALVPPKKAGVFRSVVNIKLIAKSSSAAEKTVVIVTTDPSITKLAAATKVPITKDLKTAPTIPVVEEEEVKVVKEDLEEPAEEEDKNADDEKEPAEDEDEKADEPEGSDEDEPEGEGEKKEEEPVKDHKAKKVAKKLKAAGDKVAKKIKLRKKLIIFGIIGLILLVVALVWAFVIAPAADVMVEIKTTLNNFSENISFTSVITEENADEGKFYLEETKNEKVAEKKFEATGTKNVGKKATGTIAIWGFFPLNVAGSTAIDEGTVFTISGLDFIASESGTISYSGNKYEECDNKDDKESLVEFGCQISTTITVVAKEPGTNYNIAASHTGWETSAPIGVYSDEAMAGGTDETITIVQQSDIDKALEDIAATSADAEKEALLDKVKDDALVINSSFKTATSDPVATPAVGEEVKDGVKPTVKVTTTSTIFSIDETKVKEFISKKAKLSEGQKIYQIKDPFIDNFLKTENGYTGKLKTSYSYGPEITESSVVETIKGKGLGEAQHALKDINGVSEVRIKPSFPWVTFVPGDENKITVNLEIKDFETKE